MEKKSKYWKRNNLYLLSWTFLRRAYCLLLWFSRSSYQYGKLARSELYKRREQVTQYERTARIKSSWTSMTQDVTGPIKRSRWWHSEPTKHCFYPRVNILLLQSFWVIKNNTFQKTRITFVNFSWIVTLSVIKMNIGAFLHSRMALTATYTVRHGRHVKLVYVFVRSIMHSELHWLRHTTKNIN